LFILIPFLNYFLFKLHSPMGPHKASKSPPSISRLRRKEKVRGLYALPLELFKSSLPLKAKNHHYSGEHGGCVFIY